MTPTERYALILDYHSAALKIAHPGYEAAVDISPLDEHLIKIYSERSGADIQVQSHQLIKCRQLNRDLGNMYRLGILGRYKTYMGDECGYGSPKWFYVYTAKRTS